MARKKQEIQLQREIETQEEWEEVMAMEGLWVVDVYQEWCGPCQALVGNFRRLKNELGDPLLHYAVAKADTVDGLEKYRGRCEPTFLFYAGGILVSFIHGANAPKLQRVITEQLAQEHKVLDGTGERKEVKDTVITRLEEKAMEQAEADEAAREAEEAKLETDGGETLTREDQEVDGEAFQKELSLTPKEELVVLEEPLSTEEVPKGVTVAIIKPDAVAQGKVDEIVQEIKDNGIEIIAEEERELTEEEATELYSELKDEAYFNDLIKFITSGPSHLLVITQGTTGETVVKDWRDMIGPTQVEAAKEEAPDSLRAKYGESGYMNALHGSSSSEAAARELAFFFPNLAVPTYKRKKLNIQRTLALIRPEAFNAKKDEILAKITEAGFKIAMYKEIQLTKEQVCEFYKEHEGQSYFDQLVEHMSSAPVLALGLAGDEAITAWRDMLGPPSVDEATETSPGSMRAMYAGESGINQFHGSDSEEAAKKELNFFFPMEETIAVIKPSGMGTRDAIIDRIHEAGFKIAARKETTITKDIAEILYPNHADKDYYDDLVESMTSGPTMFMVLTREDAVHGWRQEIGETNPEDAKVTNPESLRAQFGLDLLNNAVHGSSTRERAREEMKAVFGDLQFNEDGSVKGEEPELDEASEALVKGRSSPTAETAPEYRNEGDTTAEGTETDADTTQNITWDTTQDVTADTTQQDQTQEPTAEDGETAQGDTTVAETTEGDPTATETATQESTQEETEADETQGDTTVADTTQADTTQADTTQADTTQADTTQADTTQADVTQADVTQADVTEAETTAEPSNEATQEEGASSAADGQTTATETGESTAQEETTSPAADEKPDEKPETKEADEKPGEETVSQTSRKGSPEPKEQAEESVPEKEVEEKSPSEEASQEVKLSSSPAPEQEAGTKSATPSEEPKVEADSSTKGASDDAQEDKGQEATDNNEDKKDETTTGARDSAEAEKPAESETS